MFLADNTLNNAFLKLWEIYDTYPELLNKETMNCFHGAEAPGSFILATNCKLNQLNKKHIWYANSLNPDSIINKA